MSGIIFAFTKNKDADLLHCNCVADQHLWFCYIDSIIPPLLKSEISNFKPLPMFCGCTDCFVSDLVGNLKDRFSRNMAHPISVWDLYDCEGCQVSN